MKGSNTIKAVIPRLGAMLVFAGLTVSVLPLVAGANHPATTDIGVDQVWSEPMNHESYWESLWDAECTKYENHSGYIPAIYDAAVIKDGNSVRVYADLTNVGAFTALGALNPNAQHPNRRFEAPHSWVMKCVFNEDTTTTTEATTTTLPEETTTVPEETTTVPEETTTTQETTTTTQSRVAEWTASAECETITVGFDTEQIEGIRVTIFSFGFPLVLDDLLTEPGEYTVDAPETVLLEAVPWQGFVVKPESFQFDIESCSVTTTTVPETTTTQPETTTTDPGTTTTAPPKRSTTPSTLPFTGPEQDTGKLIALASSLAGAGVLLLLMGRGRKEEDESIDI